MKPFYVVCIRKTYNNANTEQYYYYNSIARRLWMLVRIFPRTVIWTELVHRYLRHGSLGISASLRSWSVHSNLYVHDSPFLHDNLKQVYFLLFISGPLQPDWPTEFLQSVESDFNAQSCISRIELNSRLYIHTSLEHHDYNTTTCKTVEN